MLSEFKRTTLSSLGLLPAKLRKEVAHSVRRDAWAVVSDAQETLLARLYFIPIVARYFGQRFGFFTQNHPC